MLCDSVYVENFKYGIHWPFSARIDLLSINSLIQLLLTNGIKSNAELGSANITTIAIAKASSSIPIYSMSEVLDLYVTLNETNSFSSKICNYTREESNSKKTTKTFLLELDELFSNGGRTFLRIV